MTLQAWGAASLILGVILTSLTLALMIGKPLRRLARQNEEFREDWYGTPARPGRDPVPGVPERLARIEKELQPNSGSSLRDAINRVEARTERVEARLEDHVRTHVGGTS